MLASSSKFAGLAYLEQATRKRFIDELVRVALGRLSDWQILQSCPQYLGPDVTEKHREYVRDMVRTELNRLDDYLISRRYCEATDPEGLEADSFKEGKFVGREEDLH